MPYQLQASPKRYLFLDFDGVLHVEGGPLFESLHLLESVLYHNQHVDIVISSTWRLTHSIEQLRAPFMSELRHRVVGVTPSLPNGLHPSGRQKEIESFIYANSAVPTRPSPWVAIDDTEELFLPNCKQLLWVDGNIGFRPGDEARLAEMLGCSP